MARKNSLYRFVPVLIDHDHKKFAEYIVRVIELPGCPRARMPKQFAHIETLKGKVIGMAHTNSLLPLSREQRTRVLQLHRETKADVKVYVGYSPQNHYVWLADCVDCDAQAF